MFILLLAALLLLLLEWNIYYRRHWYRQVDVTLDFDRTSVYAGEQVELTEVITNRKKLPLPVLEVGFHTRKELVFRDTENTNVSDYVYKRDIFAVLGRQRITRKISILCQKRGYYKVEEADITAFSLLYRKRYSQALTTNAAIYVYPAQVNVSETMTVCERMLGIMQCSRHLYEDPFTFRGIREYTTSDPMKTINWKASARTGGLMVNTFDSVMTQKVMLYLDVEDGGILKQEELVEESIALAASLIRKCMRQGMEAGLLTNAQYRSETKADIGIMEENRQENVFCEAVCINSKTYLTRIERMLALYRKEDGWKPYEDCLIQTKAEDAVMIFISKNDTLEKQKMIEDFLRKERNGILLCPVYRGEQPSIDTAANLKFMTREVEKG